jgi:hypothetical protein
MRNSLLAWTGIMLILGALLYYFLGTWLSLGPSYAMIDRDQGLISNEEYGKTIAMYQFIRASIPYIIAIWVLIWILGAVIVYRRRRNARAQI